MSKPIILTAPNGMKLEVDPDKISLVSPNVDMVKTAKAVVRIDGENHAVLETPAQIDKLRGIG